MKREDVSHEVNRHLPNSQMYRRLIGQTEKPVEVRVRELAFMVDSFDHPIKQGMLGIQTNLTFTQKWIGEKGQIPLMVKRSINFLK